MRFATCVLDGAVRSVVVDGGQVHPLGNPSLHARPLQDDLTMLEVVAGGLDGARAAGERALARPGTPLERPGTPLERVRLVAPLRPPSIRDFVTFEEHVEGVRRSVDGAEGVPPAWFDAPTFYFANPHTVIGPGDVVAFPAASTARDFELEVAAVVGSEVRSVAPGEAAAHIFGYTILNDWSARDLQGREMKVGLGPAKGKDFATTLGPWIVTPDELDDCRDADGFLDPWCSALVNGVEVGHDLLSNMGWTFETMLAHASRDSRLVPGDVLGSGTTGHGGCLAELWGVRGRQDPPPLRDGDVVTLSVEGIGRLTNRVGSAGPTPAIPAPRRRDAAAARAARAGRGTDRGTDTDTTTHTITDTGA